MTNSTIELAALRLRAAFARYARTGTPRDLVMVDFARAALRAAYFTEETRRAVWLAAFAV